MPKTFGKMPKKFEGSKEKQQLDYYDELVTEMLSMISKHLHQINTDENYTPQYKTYVKNFYLEHFVTPAARAVYLSYFPKNLRSVVPLPDDSSGHRKSAKQ
jgi:hypothetical protein